MIKLYKLLYVTTLLLALKFERCSLGQVQAITEHRRSSSILRTPTKKKRRWEKEGKINSNSQHSITVCMRAYTLHTCMRRRDVSSIFGWFFIFIILYKYKIQHLVVFTVRRRMYMLCCVSRRMKQRHRKSGPSWAAHKKNEFERGNS